MSINPNAIPEYRPNPRIKSKAANWLLAALFFSVVLGCVLVAVVYSNGARIACVLTNCRHNPTGASAAWSEQYAAIKAELVGHPDAVFDSVMALPVASWPSEWTLSHTLESRVTYRLPTGTFVAKYQDSSPTSTIRASTYVDKDRQEAQVDYDRLANGRGDIAQQFERVRISPREAEIATWQEALEEAEREGITVKPSVFLSYGLAGPDEHPDWLVTYSPIAEDEPPGILAPLGDFLGYSSQFHVDAVTGEITERDMGTQTRP